MSWILAVQILPSKEGFGRESPLLVRVPRLTWFAAVER